MPRPHRIAVLLRDLSQAHKGFSALLAAGLVARIACAVAYWPGLFYSDSWAYLRLAYAGSPVAFLPDRPSGYPLAIRFLTLPARQAAIISTAQHLVGLIIGTLVYVLLLRAGTRRWLALAAAAVVLLDADLIVLEQYVMPETFFGLCLVSSAYLGLAPRPTVGRLAASGALLAVAVTIRSAGLFAIPVWIVFVLRSGVPIRVFFAWAGVLLAPLMAYAALQSATGQGSALNSSEGWFLYERVAGFARCSDENIPAAARDLCPTGSERGLSGPRYIWGNSPATRRFPGGPSARNSRADALLRRFALGVIRDQPITYAWTVTKDTGRLFLTDGGTEASDLLELPTAHKVALANSAHAQLRHAYFASSPASRVQFPASVFRYYRYLCTPGWLTLLLVLASVAALARAARRRREAGASHASAVFVLSGSALAVVVGTVATVGPDYRYLLSVLPALVAGAALAFEDLLQARRSSSNPRRAAAAIDR